MLSDMFIFEEEKQLLNTSTEIENDEFITVTQLSKLVQKSLEIEYSNIKIQGEMSGVTIHASGHIYFALKDDNGVIDCIFWRGGKLSFKPENGLKVNCHAKMTTYAMRSKYQLIINAMEVSGAGSLFKMLQERKEKFLKEGLFDKKRPIAKIPKIIGIITSPTGAVIRDIMIRLKDRMVNQLIFYPAKVQGDGADRDICDGIKELNKEFKKICYENEYELSKTVIIIARGGGSIEDLWTFQEESVVRAIFDSEVPIISAIGHETDINLSDFAADLRAPTPTAAAEIVAPLRSDLFSDKEKIFDILSKKIHVIVETRKHYLDFHTKGLKSFEYLLSKYINLYDDKVRRFDHSFELLVQKKHIIIVKISKPVSYVTSANAILNRCSDNLNAVRCDKVIEKQEKRLKYLSDILKSLSYEDVMKRGFCIVENDGKTIKTALQARLADVFDVKFRDSAVKVKVKNDNQIK